ncbi:SDR family oxidoreductase [Paraburkholderia phymatum]|uniref:Short-chain dehydrogenase/reductase SDR n=1 Tax=Paraburkholderia phymatum (strain DSM 17167 / CIP 108236 / LMG 21445 / STM815) TaxID=391038 RepID=B2JUR9_PARP8|nr:SDR family oxidoreductase [Paraburkholderia phymatum]ACC76240.1 short-chain dehydrogenase/reductase SDR [Paraburkholderia phymatum STM815]
MRGIRQPETVVITGATAGVGRAAALEFARHGADVALLARDSDALHETAQELRAEGVRVLSIKVDVSDADAVEAAAASIEARLGPIDVWVNNAMVTAFAPIDALAHRDFARITDVTYHGYVWGTMAALKRMSPRNHGVIVQVGSALAYRSIPLQSAYCGAKHAIRGFTDALRCELHHRKSRIHVTMVQMPALNTPQFEWAQNEMPHAPKPVAPIFQPEVAARAIYWAATHRRREVWVGSSSIKAIVANEWIPGWLDRYLGRTGIGAQQDDTLPARHRQPSNLWQPVSGLHRVHGRFDAQASSTSPALWLDTHRGVAMLAVAGLAALCARAARRRM